MAVDVDGIEASEKDVPVSPLTAVFVLALGRLLGVALALPNIASRSISGLRFRIAAAFLLALLIAPACQLGTQVDASQRNQVVVAGFTELLVGVVLGVGVNVMFAGVQVVSQVLGTASGLSIGSFLGNGAAGSPLTQFLDYLSLAIFLAIGGHRMVVDVLLTTMREVPLGTSAFHTDLIGALASLLTLSFAMGLRASFPVLISLLTAIIVVGALSRFLPRFQVFVSAAGLNAAVLIGSLFIFMGTIGWSLQEQIPLYLERLVACLATSA